MLYAFVVHPIEDPSRAKVFLSDTVAHIAGFEPEYLEKNILRALYSGNWELEDMIFLEVGEYHPISLEKKVSYILHQE
jgi:hypothetical protein